MRHGKEDGNKEECDHAKRDSRGQVRIHEISVELSVHGSAAGLQRTTEDDEGNDPACIHLK